MELTKEQELELLIEKMRAYQQLTVEARAYFKEEIKALAEKIKALQQ